MSLQTTLSEADHATLNLRVSLLTVCVCGWCALARHGNARGTMFLAEPLNVTDTGHDPVQMAMYFQHGASQGKLVREFAHVCIELVMAHEDSGSSKATKAWQLLLEVPQEQQDSILSRVMRSCALPAMLATLPAILHGAVLSAHLKECADASVLHDDDRTE